MEDLEIQDLEVRVLNYLSRFKKVYTKTLYKALSIKSNYKLSLNKFRNFMYELEKLGKVGREYYNSLSAWIIK